MVRSDLVVRVVAVWCLWWNSGASVVVRGACSGLVVPLVPSGWVSRALGGSLVGP